MVKYNRYNRIFSLLLVLVGTLFLVSCQNDVSGPRFGEDTYSLAALLVDGAPIDLNNPLYISRSASLEDFDFADIFVGDAEVKIWEITGTDTTASLVLQPVLDLSENDVPPIPKIKYIDPSGHVIRSGKTYRVEATIPGYSKTIWAETVVPATAVPVTDFLGQNVPGEGYSLNPAQMDSIAFDGIDQRYPLALNTGDFTGKLNLFVEIFCLEEFSTDLEWTIPIFGITNADSSIAWVYNNSGDSMRRISLFASFVAQYFDNPGGNYVILENFAQAIAFFGRYRFTIYSVDDNYYRYRYMNEGYLGGGVHNALGYFGSASGGKLYTKVIKGSPGS